MARQRVICHSIVTSRAIAQTTSVEAALAHCPRDSASAALGPQNGISPALRSTHQDGGHPMPGKLRKLLRCDHILSLAESDVSPGHRLPTEDEWEIASRVDERAFPWGNVWTGQECHTRRATMGAAREAPHAFSSTSTHSAWKGWQIYPNGPAPCRDEYVVRWPLAQWSDGSPRGKSIPVCPRRRIGHDGHSSRRRDRR